MDKGSLSYSLYVTLFMTCFVASFQECNKLHQVPALLLRLFTETPRVQDVKTANKMVISKFIVHAPR